MSQVAKFFINMIGFDEKQTFFYNFIVFINRNYIVKNDRLMVHGKVGGVLNYFAWSSKKIDLNWILFNIRFKALCYVRLHPQWSLRIIKIKKILVSSLVNRKTKVNELIQGMQHGSPWFTSFVSVKYEAVYTRMK